MKYVMIVGDGMAGRPLDELGGKTPLQGAEKPTMDWIASEGSSGTLRNVPDGMQSNSDVAIMSLLGYDPEVYYTGRGPLEAAGMDIELGSSEVAFRCNLITEKDGRIHDYSAGHVSTDEAEELLEDVKEEHGKIGDFYVGVDYRHLFVLDDPEGETDGIESTPPHHAVGESYNENLIRPRDLDIARKLNDMITSSREVLSDHPVNAERAEAGKNPANSIWLWGEGREPDLESLEESYGITGAVISAVTLVKGLGAAVGMDKVAVPGATGYYDTSYENKADYALEALEDHDFVLVHVEAPDEAGHMEDVERKIEAIENLDSRLVKRIVDGMDDDYTIVVTADHPTPIELGGHSSDPVPFSVYSKGGERDGLRVLDEMSARGGSWGELEGHEFLGKLVREYSQRE